MNVDNIKYQLATFDQLDGASVLAFGFSNVNAPEEQEVWIDFRLHRLPDGANQLVKWKDIRVLAKRWVEFSWINLRWDTYLTTNWPAGIRQESDILVLDFDELHPKYSNPNKVNDVRSHFFIAGKEIRISEIG